MKYIQIVLIALCWHGIVMGRFETSEELQHCKEEIKELREENKLLRAENKELRQEIRQEDDSRRKARAECRDCHKLVMQATRPR